MYLTLSKYRENPCQYLELWRHIIVPRVFEITSFVSGLIGGTKLKKKQIKQYSYARSNIVCPSMIMTNPSRHLRCLRRTWYLTFLNCKPKRNVPDTSISYRPTIYKGDVYVTYVRPSIVLCECHMSVLFGRSVNFELNV